jgi:hypothetical protein
MPDARASIEKHYGFDGLVDRILAALEAAGHDTANLTVEMLNLVDQMHFGGLDSTKRQAAPLGASALFAASIPDVFAAR